MSTKWHALMAHNQELVRNAQSQIHFNVDQDSHTLLNFSIEMVQKMDLNSNHLDTSNWQDKCWSVWTKMISKFISNTVRELLLLVQPLVSTTSNTFLDLSKELKQPRIKLKIWSHTPTWTFATKTRRIKRDALSLDTKSPLTLLIWHHNSSQCLTRKSDSIAWIVICLSYQETELELDSAHLNPHMKQSECNQIFIVNNCQSHSDQDIRLKVEPDFHVTMLWLLIP